MVVMVKVACEGGEMQTRAKCRTNGQARQTKSQSVRNLEGEEVR